MNGIDAGRGFGGRRAVVIGGSVAGLLAARVLVEHFAEVVVVERDPLPDSFETRKGVPQGQQLHGLLDRGEEILEELFPGLVAALLLGGAIRADFGRDVRWFHFGAWKARFDSGVRSLMMSRPYLEGHLRRRLFALPGIRRLDAHDVTDFTADATRTRVTGITMRHREDGVEEVLDADLVVDASGRGSRTPKWLEALGYERPEESVVKVDVKYATRIFRREAGVEPTVRGGGKMLYVIGKYPESKRIGLILPMEGDRWIALVCGLLGDHPPDDADGYLAFARGMSVPDLYDAIKDLEPLSEVMTYKFGANLRRHYERLRRIPEGLIVVGDALCSFNPIYGQGMTVAALGALDLRASLCEQPRGTIRGLSRRFFTKIGKTTEIPWMMSTAEDFRYPQVEGRRPFGLPLMEWYMSHVHRATRTDLVVLLPFLKAMHMTGSPLALFSPSIALRALRHGRPSPTAGA